MYDKALQRDRELVPAKWFKAEIFLRNGQVNEALKTANEAIIDHPNVTQFYGIKHAALMLQGKNKVAYDFIVDKENLYTKEGRSLIYYQMLGLSLLSLDKTKEFDQLIKKISQQKYSKLTHQQKYLSLLKLYREKNYNAVITGFESLVEENIQTVLFEVTSISVRHGSNSVST